jgi:hypothetical protein
MDNNYEKFVKDLYREREQWASVGTTKENPEFSKHFRKWNFFDTEFIINKPGKVFLFEKYESGTISYPKIGIYLNSIPCDQTVEIEWYEVRRTWEYNSKYEVDGKKYDFCYLNSVISSMPIWNDYLLIYGVWDSIPDWKTLRKYYERTWWFHRSVEEQRDIDISRILR